MGRFSNDHGQGNFQQVPPGTYVARCYRIVDIGTQIGEYKGVPNRRNQIVIGWELPDETMQTEEGEKPMVVSRFYTNSLADKANLRHDLESWRGREFSRAELDKFDLETIIGAPCMVSVIKGDNDKTKVATISGVPKSMQVPPQINPPFTFWLDEFDQAKFDSLSEGLQNIIKKSEEYENVVNGHIPDQPRADDTYDDDDDSIPF